MSGAKILLFCRLSLFTKYHKMFKIAVSFSGGVLKAKRGCVISHTPNCLFFSLYIFTQSISIFTGNWDGSAFPTQLPSICISMSR